MKGEVSFDKLKTKEADDIVKLFIIKRILQVFILIFTIYMWIGNWGQIEYLGDKPTWGLAIGNSDGLSNFKWFIRDIVLSMRDYTDETRTDIVYSSNNIAENIEIFLMLLTVVLFPWSLYDMGIWVPTASSSGSGNRRNVDEFIGYRNG